MSRATPRPCPHDLRPGTTVCLHCRREANLEARARLRRQVLRVATGLSVVAVVGIAVALLGVGRSAAGSLPAPASRSVARHTARVAAATAPAARDTAFPVRPTGSAAGTPAAPATPSLSPMIGDGRHDLGAGMYAERTGDTVLVHFDTPEARTRHPEKFERTVRQTLPAVYGPVADSMLAAVPDGQLAAGGDLLTELPTRGIRLAAPSGAAIMLWPQTRPGEDGPLVVTYRVVPSR